MLVEADIPLEPFAGKVEEIVGAVVSDAEVVVKLQLVLDRDAI